MAIEQLTNIRTSGNYLFVDFSPKDRPDDELLVRSIQRQSYIENGLVDPDHSTVIEVDSLGNKVEVLDPSITNLTDTGDGYRVECVLGKEQDGTGMVAYKKYYADSMDTVPAYQFGRSSIRPEEEKRLRIAAANGAQFAEMAAMSKTPDARKGAIRELMKYEIRRRLGRSELWLCAIAPDAGEAFNDIYGHAIKRIGNPIPPRHPLIRKSLTMVMVDVDNFYSNMEQSAAAKDNPYSERQRRELEYMTS